MDNSICASPSANCGSVGPELLIFMHISGIIQPCMNPDLYSSSVSLSYLIRLFAVDGSSQQGHAGDYVSNCTCWYTVSWTSLFNTLRPRQKFDTFQVTYSNVFSWVKFVVFWFKFCWNLLLMIQSITNQHWRQAIIWANDNLDYMKPICFTGSQWVKQTGVKATKHGMKKVHDDVIKWKHFPRYWPFVRGIPHTKASDAELWCFLWSTPE